MKPQTTILAIACCMMASCALAGTYIVDPSGGGDFDDLALAWYSTGLDDTLVLVPGTYEVYESALGWPLRIDGDNPAIVSQAGAGQTELRGDGLVWAFSVIDHAHVHIEGVAFRQLGEVLHKYPLYPDVCELIFFAIIRRVFYKYILPDGRSHR